MNKKTSVYMVYKVIDDEIKSLWVVTFEDQRHYRKTKKGAVSLQRKLINKHWR